MPSAHHTAVFVPCWAVCAPRHALWMPRWPSAAICAFDGAVCAPLGTHTAVFGPYGAILHAPQPSAHPMVLSSVHAALYVPRCAHAALCTPCRAHAAVFGPMPLSSGPMGAILHAPWPSALPMFRRRLQAPPRPLIAPARSAVLRPSLRPYCRPLVHATRIRLMHCHGALLTLATAGNTLAMADDAPHCRLTCPATVCVPMPHRAVPSERPAPPSSGSMGPSCAPWGHFPPFTVVCAPRRALSTPRTTICVPCSALNPACPLSCPPPPVPPPRALHALSAPSAARALCTLPTALATLVCPPPPSTPLTPPHRALHTPSAPVSCTLLPYGRPPPSSSAPRCRLRPAVVFGPPSSSAPRRPLDALCRHLTLPAAV
ncbi:hypothetical protein DENSPDRAFT_886770 [Dentipellis sp. KUC8613]|nr:hypothetical protein DENSPDRAFT_886770 [Dentipellis sp. KUC8613]